MAIARGTDRLQTQHRTATPPLRFEGVGCYGVAVLAWLPPKQAPIPQTVVHEQDWAAACPAPHAVPPHRSIAFGAVRSIARSERKDTWLKRGTDSATVPRHTRAFQRSGGGAPSSPAPQPRTCAPPIEMTLTGVRLSRLSCRVSLRDGALRPDVF